MYDESKEALKTVPPSSLKNRLNFHLSHKLGDEGSLMDHHEQLQDVLEDQLSLAAIHYLRAHYQEAIDIYKRILLQNRQVETVISEKLITPGYYVSNTLHSLNQVRNPTSPEKDVLTDLNFMDQLLANTGYYFLLHILTYFFVLINCICREHLALNVYVALCYYKLDYYDVSQDVLSIYLTHYPDSVIATNLKVKLNKKYI